MENGFQDSNFEELSPAELDMVLQRFYAALQSIKGKEYSKSAIVGIRAGLNRHLTSPPFSRLLNIMNDRPFMQSNQVLTGLIKGLKKIGKDLSKHKEAICEEDHQKLYESGEFSVTTPETLQNKVMFELIAQFGRRGREGLYNLRKDSFVFRTDVRGRKYVTLKYNEADKNVKEPRMYGTGDEFCPLLSFEKYKSKLNTECDSLFQRPIPSKKITESSAWYENAPLGVNKVNTFMSRLSESAKLSKRYTNNCIRAFVSTYLHQKGFSNEGIMTVTGHRNVQSLTSCIKPHDDEKMHLSNAITYRSTKSSQPSLPCTATESLPHTSL